MKSRNDSSEGFAFVRHLRKTAIPVIVPFFSALLLCSATLHAQAIFSNYELAGNPFVTGFSVGTACPNSSGTCTNTEGEPSIRADKNGNFYGSSENVFCVIGGLCGGTFAWKSTDGGNHFTTLPLPNSASFGNVGIAGRRRHRHRRGP